MKAEAEREAAILQKIKMKMDRIKATQQRVLEEHEPKHHAAGKNIIRTLFFPKMKSRALNIFNKSCKSFSF